MLKVPYGQTSKHILESRGGDSDILNFYSTTNNSTYSRKFDGFRPTSGDKLPRENSGFTSNIRTPVYYSKHLDEVDNPGILPLIADNYHSETDKKFRPFQYVDGTETLANVAKAKESSYIGNSKIHVPTNAQVMNNRILDRVGAAPVDIMPRYQPYLHSIQPKDTTEMENHGYGPSNVTTETQEKFKGQQLDRNINGNKLNPSETGFTHNKSVEPLSFHPEGTYSRDVPAFLTNRPTGISITHSHYLPFAHLTGNEIPPVANRCDKNSAYSRESAKNCLPSDDNNSSFFPPKQAVDVGYFGNTAVGNKELSGEARNHKSQIDAFSESYPARFLTEYNYRFQNCVPQGDLQNRETRVGVLKPQEDGFTRSTKLHYN